LRIIKWVNGLDLPPDNIDPCEYGDAKLREKLDEKDPSPCFRDELILRENARALDYFISSTVRSAVRGGPSIDTGESSAHFDFCDAMDKITERALRTGQMTPGGLREERKLEILIDLRNALEGRGGYGDFIRKLTDGGHLPSRAAQSEEEEVASEVP